MSSSTLLRGVELTRGATMSLESDPLYLSMMEEKKQLQVSRSQPIPVYLFQQLEFSAYKCGMDGETNSSDRSGLGVLGAQHSYTRC